MVTGSAKPVTRESEPFVLPSELLEKLPKKLNAQLKRYFCCNCGRFLAYQAIIEGTIVIPCHKCKTLNVLDARY